MKFRIFGLTILLCVLGWGCVEDSTNTAITEMNRITFKGIEEDYICDMGDSLIIRPEFDYSLPEEKRDEYSYLWYFSTGQTMYVADTLSREKDLEVIITALPGDYHLNYKVVNERTGVFDTYRCNVRVDGAYSKGMLVLAENDGYA